MKHFFFLHFSTAAVREYLQPFLDFFFFGKKTFKLCVPIVVGLGGLLGHYKIEYLHISKYFK